MSLWKNIYEIRPSSIQKWSLQNERTQPHFFEQTLPGIKWWFMRGTCPPILCRKFQGGWISLPNRYLLGAQVVWGRYNLTRSLIFSVKNLMVVEPGFPTFLAWFLLMLAFNLLLLNLTRNTVPKSGDVFLVKWLHVHHPQLLIWFPQYLLAETSGKCLEHHLAPVQHLTQESCLKFQTQPHPISPKNERFASKDFPFQSWLIFLLGFQKALHFQGLVYGCFQKIGGNSPKMDGL